MLQQQQEQSHQFVILSRRVLTLFGPGHFYCLKVQGVFRDPLKSHTGKNLWFSIYVYNMVLVVYLTYFMKPVKETTFSSKIHKAFLANIHDDCVFSVIKNKQYSYAIGVWALSSWFPFHLQITGKCKLYKFHRNRKRVLNMQVYYSFLFMYTRNGACTTWARICSISEAYHQY